MRRLAWVPALSALGAPPAPGACHANLPTGRTFPGHGRIQAAAGPVRLCGGSALVVHPKP